MTIRGVINQLLLSVPFLGISSCYAASTGIFVGIGIGHSIIETPSDSVFKSATPAESGYKNIITDSVHDIGGMGINAYTGYNFNRYFGIELSYNEFAQSEYQSKQSAVESETTIVSSASSQITFKSKSYNLVGRGSFSFDNGIEIFGRGGVAYVLQEEHYSTSTDQSSYNIPVNTDKLATPDLGNTTTQKFRPTVGVGIGYHFNTHMGVGFAWNYVFGQGNLKNDKNAIASLQMLTLELTYSL